MENQVAELRAFAEQVKADGILHVVLLGMGGSSLAPEVFQQIFGNAAGYPELLVLDSTHPAAVKALDARIDPARTLFVVSSKSGTTTETNSFLYYFWDRLKPIKEDPGRHFIAITDSGTPLEKLARERNFRAVFNAPEDVGGRYSALTVFGLVPAALIGADIGAILLSARRMSEACGAAEPERIHPGLVLGAALAELAAAKRDKVTFLCAPSLSAFPTWLEQLIAESTGKDRKGIVPVAHEPIAAPEKYGSDRVFVYLRLDGDENHGLDRQFAALQANGHPVARLDLKAKSDLGQEFYRWEFAVAAAGAAMGINPFNQPDVQLAKDLAKKAMNENSGNAVRVREEVPVADGEALRKAVASWLGKKKTRDYVSVQAYLDPSPEDAAQLQALVAALQERLGAAITLGFGPRFLHSTGQLHKGGANTVMVLQILDQPTADLTVPETNYTFDALIRAQALGDYLALKQRRRRVLRVNLGGESASGLARLTETLQS
jgi:transaldolase/glucose-6-phosphate isomerase